MLRKAILGGLLMLASAASPALAQTTDGYHSIIRLPLVASTSTFTSTIYIHNPLDFGNGTINVAPFYYGATGTPTGGVACTVLAIPQGHTFAGNLASMCPLNAGSNFGQVYLQEVDAENHPFSGYSRVESFSGNGFSVEGFSPGAFHNNLSYSYVTGLKRQAAAPQYQSNCFVSALFEAVDVTVALLDAAGTQIGSTQTYTLASAQTIRILDIFTAVGAPATDFSNVTARFYENTTGEPAYMAFCTVQNNTSFDADFRIAKDARPDDIRVEKSQFANADALGNNFSITSLSLKNIHVAYMNEPDWVQCQITGANTANLEFQLKNPSGVVVAGGNNATSFPEVYLGQNDTFLGGGGRGVRRWFIEVSPSGGGTPPFDYGIACQSGNGMTPFDLIATVADDF